MYHDPRKILNHFLKLNHFLFLQYFDMDDLEKDFMQLCKNAQIYNEENSLIHEDSIALQSVFINIRQKLEAEGGSNLSEEEKGNLIISNSFSYKIF